MDIHGWHCSVARAWVHAWPTLIEAVGSQTALQGSHRGLRAPVAPLQGPLGAHSVYKGRPCIYIADNTLQADKASWPLELAAPPPGPRHP